MNSSEMNYWNALVKSSYHVIMVNQEMVPGSFGSGCIVKYKDRYFFLTVAHVTDQQDLAACVETNQPPVNGQSALYSLGAMCFFDLYQLPKNKALNIQSADDLFSHFKERLDISFCEIKEEVAFLQPAWHFGVFDIEAGPKIVLSLDLAGRPEKDKMHAFCGRVRQNIDGNTIVSQPIVKWDLEYKGDKGTLHYFTLPDLISDADDYRGSSGAPILNEEGMLVALAAKVWEGTRLIYGFSIEECKRLLDFALASGML